MATKVKNASRISVNGTNGNGHTTAAAYSPVTAKVEISYFPISIMGEDYKLPIQKIDIDKIDLDPRNPRFCGILEEETEYTQQQLAEKLHNETKTGPLKASIATNGGLSVPIILDKKGKKFLAVEGNRRLACVKQLRAEALAKDPLSKEWTTITACIADAIPKNSLALWIGQIHTGAGNRGWVPASRDSYIRYLHTLNIDDKNQIAKIIGVSVATVRNALLVSKMCDDYEKVANKKDRDTKRWHIAAIPGSVRNNEDDLKTAYKWIGDGKLPSNKNVRNLPKIFSNPEAVAAMNSGQEKAYEKAMAKVISVDPTAGGQSGAVADAMKKASAEIESNLTAVTTLLKTADGTVIYLSLLQLLWQVGGAVDLRDVFLDMIGAKIDGRKKPK